MSEEHTTNFYAAYGLTIESPVRLPDLLPTTGAPAARIRRGAVGPALVDDLIAPEAPVYERPGCRVRASRRAMFFDWQLLGKALISDGAEVVVEPAPATLEEDLQPFLTGPVLAVLLHQRGHFVLHASAVEIDGVTFAFLGAKGYGKSTLAAQMRARGHQLVSDDIVPVRFAGARATTVPGYPRIKLYDDSIAAIGAAPETFPVIHRFVEKRSFRCPENFSAAPADLGAVIVLEEGADVALRRLAGVPALIEIMKNTHLGRYLESLGGQQQHLDDCRRLVERVPVFELARPHAFERTSEVAALLERTAAGLKG